MSNAVLERASVASRGKTRRSVRSVLLACVGIAALGGVAWYGHDWWTTGRFIEGTDDAYVGGNVTAIAPHVAGFISDILVTDNQQVHAGQLLVRLDDRDVRAASDHARAVLAARNATLDSLRARLVLQQTAIRQASAGLDGKTAQAAFTHQDTARYQSLAAVSAGSRQDAQRAIAMDEQARAEVVSAQAGLDAARQQLNVLQADVAEAEAAVVQAAADLRTAQLNVGYTEIRSPVDGFIGNRAAQVGGYAAVGTYLLSVVPAHGLWVDANFKEDQLGRMTPGMAATVVADVMPGQVLHGHVLSLAPGTGAVFAVIPPENATGNFTKIVQRVPVRIELDDTAGTLGRIRPGLSTYVSVDTRSGTGP